MKQLQTIEEMVKQYQATLDEAERQRQHERERQPSLVVAYFRTWLAKQWGLSVDAETVIHITPGQDDGDYRAALIIGAFSVQAGYDFTVSTDDMVYSRLTMANKWFVTRTISDSGQVQQWRFEQLAPALHCVFMKGEGYEERMHYV